MDQSCLVKFLQFLSSIILADKYAAPRLTKYLTAKQHTCWQRHFQCPLKWRTVAHTEAAWWLFSFWLSFHSTWGLLHRWFYVLAWSLWRKFKFCRAFWCWAISWLNFLIAWWFILWFILAREVSCFCCKDCGCEEFLQETSELFSTVFQAIKWLIAHSE